MAIINSIISGGGGGGSPWTFYKNVYSKDYTLAETDYATWTPSGTASVIISDVIGYSSESLDLTNKEYLIKKTITIDFVYLAGATMKSAPIQYIFQTTSGLYRRPNSNLTASALTFPLEYNVNNSITTIHILGYYNTSGNQYSYINPSIYYGIYCSNMPNVTVGTTSNPVSYQISTPRISARCNNSYFSTARASEVDQNNTLIKIRYDIYQGNVGSCDASKSWLDAINLYNSLN